MVKTSIDKIKIRNTVFTLHNWQPCHLEALKAYRQISYCSVGEEFCPDTGTPHLQGYVEFKNQVLLSTFKNLFLPLTVWTKKRRGSSREASDYTEKDGTFHQWGDISRPGFRSDLEGPIQMITEGRRMREVAVEYPQLYVQYHRGFHALQNILIEPRDEVPEVIVYHGTTGKGKSKRSREETDPNDRFIWKPAQGKWFNGYEGQNQCIFEEFRGQLPFGQILDLLDRYDCKVETKGGMCEFRATKIIINSPLHPIFWYKDDSIDKVDQLMRRITSIIEL